MTSDLRLDQQRRYARQIMLNEVGVAGQQKLLNARVLIIGAGGLGSALISYLAAAGVGHLGIIDLDRVERSNLARQIIHETGDIGRLKVESASDRVAELNPDVEVTTYPFALTAENAEAVIGGVNSPPEGESTRHLSASVGGDAAPKSPHGFAKEANPVPPQGGSIFSGYDVIADGCDNFQTRLLVNATCHALGKPLVSAAIAGFSGQVMSIIPALTAHAGCYQCLVNPEAPEANTCTDSGIIGPLAGIIGSMQALEVIHTLLGRPALAAHIALYDARTMTQRLTARVRDPHCRICHA